MIDTKQIDINAKDQFGETALHRASKQNNRGMVELLARNGADLTTKNNNSLRASVLAAFKGYNHLVPYLVNPKAEFLHEIQAMYDMAYCLEIKVHRKAKLRLI
ncbi:ankyrin repeat domain-containing protein [Legionella sainthelensi]|uniref:ankyrin repeat domain-containing protein n=1 Tax=Legionella sainthelensi TaxID=28087 RepID=UPI000E20A14F|nr:ankyrin repeat domain-containing protein [Legionella sainthelensi]